MTTPLVNKAILEARIIIQIEKISDFTDKLNKAKEKLEDYQSQLAACK